MSDPELAARAQRAAARLEQSWERWRRLRGLNNEPSQPISSYVGYSLVEPWGRPRVVFGVGAEEAEQLSALLEGDERADPRYNQGLLWEAEVPAQARPSDSQPIERAAQGRVQAEHNERSDRADRADRAERSERAELGAPGEWGRTGFQEPVAAFSAAPVCETEAPRREPVPDLVADLAGWSSGELPGQASAGLAAWPGAKAEAERQVAGAAQREAAAAAQRQATVSAQRQPAVSADRVEPQGTPEMGQGSNSPEPTGWLRLA
jgi:hypothetical protein